MDPALCRTMQHIAQEPIYLVLYGDILPVQRQT